MKTSRLIHVFLVLAGTTLVANTGLVFAQDMPDEEPVRCLSLKRIKDTEIVGNSYILFRMVGGKNYVNVLNHACPGLARNKTIMYRTSIGQLCDLDFITVLDDIGFGFMPGASCGLGEFKPIDKEGIEDLKKAMKDSG